MSRVINFVNETDYKIPAGFADEANRLFKITQSIAKQPYQNISLVIVSNDKIRHLNKLYRHHDKVTDVLSFILQPKPLLGEVFICIEQAAKQAKRQRHSLIRELIVLTTHGWLHLFGYDHMKVNERKVMRSLTKEILQQYDKVKDG